MTPTPRTLRDVIEHCKRQLETLRMAAIGSQDEYRRGQARGYEDALRAFDALLASSAGSGWQPISVEPDHKESSSLRLLGWSAEWGYGFAQFTPFYKGRADESEMLWVFEGTRRYKPTHWQPLSPPLGQTRDEAGAYWENLERAVDRALAGSGSTEMPPSGSCLICGQQRPFAVFVFDSSVGACVDCQRAALQVARLSDDVPQVFCAWNSERGYVVSTRKAYEEDIARAAGSGSQPAADEPTTDESLRRAHRSTDTTAAETEPRLNKESQ